jgi:hypothetical protein
MGWPLTHDIYQSPPNFFFQDHSFLNAIYIAVNLEANRKAELMEKNAKLDEERLDQQSFFLERNTLIHL